MVPSRTTGGFEVSVYYNRVSDAILSHNIDADTIQNQNSGTVDYSGLDAGIKGKNQQYTGCRIELRPDPR